MKKSRVLLNIGFNKIRIVFLGEDFEASYMSLLAPVKSLIRFKCLVAMKRGGMKEKK